MKNKVVITSGQQIANYAPDNWRWRAVLNHIIHHFFKTDHWLGHTGSLNKNQESLLGDLVLSPYSCGRGGRLPLRLNLQPLPCLSLINFSSEECIFWWELKEGNAWELPKAGCRHCPHGRLLETAGPQQVEACHLGLSSLWGKCVCRMRGIQDPDCGIRSS